MELIFATQNQNKVKEIQSIMPNGIIVKSLRDINCHDDIPETAPTLEGNALQKSEYVVNKFGVNCFSDDTGLEVEALDGEPGVLSARYGGPQKLASDNMDLLLKNLKDKSNRKAQFRTAVSLIIDGQKYIFEGIVKGEIRTTKSGAKGFGYDPIFEPESSGKTFAEMSLEEKNTMSHRARAIKKMIEFLTEYQSKH